MSSVGLVASAVAEIAKVVGRWQNSKDRNRLMYRIEAATEYVFVLEKSGKYEKIDDKRQKKLLRHYRKRIFDAS